MSDLDIQLRSSDEVSDQEPLAKSAQIEYVVSHVLRYGVLLSFLIILGGSVLLFAEGGEQATVRLAGAPIPHDPRAVMMGLVHAQPKAIIDFGLMLLIATPVIRVAVSVFAFLIEDDFIYAAITLFVLLVLIASFFLGAVE